MIHSSLTAVFCFDNVGKQPVAWKGYCAEYWLNELRESMDRCTGRRDITETMMKMSLCSMMHPQKNALADVNRNFFAIGQFSASQRTSLPDGPVGCYNNKSAYVDR